jgi:hypothetical protein
MGFEESTRHKSEVRLIPSTFKPCMKQNALFLSVRPDSKPDSNGTGSSCAVTARHFFASIHKIINGRMNLQKMADKANRKASFTSQLEERIA